MSLLCNHVLVCVIHQISDQIDVMELNIIFNIFFKIILIFFFFNLFEQYDFQVHFVVCKHAFSMQENLYLFLYIPNDDRYCLRILYIPSGWNLTALIQMRSKAS